MAIKSAFISIEDCIKSFMGDTYAQDISMYQHCIAWMERFNNEMQYSVYKNFIGKFISVDSATQSGKLPDDFVKEVGVGLVTSNNEFVPLVLNSSIVINPEIPACDTPNDHCDCGCNEEVCYAFGDSNVVTIFTDVVINGETYQDSVSICAQSNGDVIRKTCVHAVSNIQSLKTYHFDITLAGMTDISNMKFIKNNVESFVGDIPDSTTFQAVWTANGWTNVSIGGGVYRFTITSTTDTWVSWTITFNSSNTTETAPITLDSTTQPTPTVSETCYEEKICEVTVLPCGCVVPTDISINVLCGANAFMFGRAYTSRYRNNKNFGETLKTANGYFGEYKIDVKAGIIKFNIDYQYDTVYLEYYSANLVDSKDYLIPVQAEECAVAYMFWKSLQRKSNADKWERKEAKLEYYNQKRLLKQLLNPLNLDTFFQSSRYLPISP